MGFLNQLADNTIFVWVILPIIIFFFKIMDVSLGTIRIIFVSRGRKYLAPILGFFEVTIWLLAISQIMQNLDNIACFIAYAAGYSMGNFVGIFIENKLAIGTLIIRIFLSEDNQKLRKELHNAGFGVTSIDAQGMNGDVKIIYTLIKRKNLDKAIEIIENFKSDCFYSVEEAKSVKKGVFPSEERFKFYPVNKLKRENIKKRK